MITLYQDCEIISTRKDMYGKLIQSQPISVKCRAKEEVKLVKNRVAEEVVSSIEFWFYPDTRFKVDDIIRYDNKDYTIMSFENNRNTLGEIIRKVVYV